MVLGIIWALKRCVRFTRLFGMLLINTVGDLMGFCVGLFAGGDPQSTRKRFERKLFWAQKWSKYGGLFTDLFEY